jgi:hypothetical protein
MNTSEDKLPPDPNNKQKSTEDSLTSLLESLASRFLDHPGFMRFGGGFEILHANWPAYPTGHGIKNALSVLADFPSNTEFFAIDNIDQCTLFVAGKMPKENEFDKNLFHVALWDEDLRDMAQKGFLFAVSVIDDRVEFHEGYLSLSDLGQHAILISELAYDVHPEIMGLVEDFLYQDRYDTAIREAAVLLESRLREFSKSKSTEYGQQLIDKCFGASSTLLPKDYPNSSRLEIRAAFRRFFKYVRNDFAHNFSSVSLVTTCRLLRRCSELLELLYEVKKLKTQNAA